MTEAHRGTAQPGFSGMIDARERVTGRVAYTIDVALPGMDGLSATQRLKGDPRTQHIPIVALTAHAMSGDEDRALAAGCAGYITKPIDLKSFRKTVGELTGRSPEAPGTLRIAPRASRLAG